MIVTTYTCDKCGHTQDTGSDMWSLRVSLDTSSGSHQFAMSKRDALWCHSCVSKLGLLPIPAASGPPVYNEEPTFEDMIRQIVREEVER